MESVPLRGEGCSFPQTRVVAQGWWQMPEAGCAGSRLPLWEIPAQGLRFIIRRVGIMVMPSRTSQSELSLQVG